ILVATMVLLYISSTTVHAFPNGKANEWFAILAHASIYLFIARTYTPITFLVIQGALGWTIFGVIWGLALGGVVFKAFFVKKYLFTSTILYVLMGWLVVLGWHEIVSNLNINGLILLVIGGLCYTVGAVFYVWRGFKYHRAVWHLFVLGGYTGDFCSTLY